MLIESRTQGLNANKFLYSPEKVSEKTSVCVEIPVEVAIPQQRKQQ